MAILIMVVIVVGIGIMEDITTVITTMVVDIVTVITIVMMDIMAIVTVTVMDKMDIDTIMDVTDIIMKVTTEKLLSDEKLTTATIVHSHTSIGWLSSRRWC